MQRSCVATELDKIDLNVLRILQQNARESAQDIGDKVGLSPSAVQRRITRLKEVGVITDEVAIVSGAAIGRDLTLIVEVALENDTAQVVKQFIEHVSQFDAVMQFYYVTGPADYVIIFQAKSMQEYDAFTQTVFFSNKHVKNFNTKVVIRAIQVKTALPLE